VKEGKWIRDANRGVELEGKTIGIIGFGHTGRAFARKLAGFDVKILAYDRYNRDGFPEQIVNCSDLTPIFEEADIVSFHVPLQDDTVHYMNASFLTQMRKSFILINSSRGNVVDSHAIYTGLKEGKLTGVCLDVIEEEPLEDMNGQIRSILNETMQRPEVLVTPHIAGYSHEALFKMSEVLLRKIVTQA
jgi:D-3-phosphoglycerate dehydrogenase